MSTNAIFTAPYMPSSNYTPFVQCAFEILRFKPIDRSCALLTLAAVLPQACELIREPRFFIFCGFSNCQFALWHASSIKKIDCIVFSANQRWNPFERSMRATPPTGDNTIKLALDFAGSSQRRLQKALLILMNNYSWTTTKSFLCMECKFVFFFVDHSLLLLLARRFGGFTREFF